MRACAASAALCASTKQLQLQLHLRTLRRSYSFSLSPRPLPPLPPLPVANESGPRKRQKQKKQKPTNTADVESSHILLHHVLLSTLAGAEYEQAVKLIVEAVRKGAEANAAAGRNARVEVAARILNNTYNALPSTSSLRPTVLLTLLHLLPRFTDLSVLPLSPPALGSALRAWDVPAAEKAAFVRAATDVYRNAGYWSVAADVAALGVAPDVGGDAKAAERAVVHAFLDDKRFGVDEVVRAGAGAGAGAAVLEGQGKELAGLLAGQGEAVGWVEKNGAWIEGQGIPKFTPALIVHKVRLLALARLFASSPTRVLSFTDISSALSISADEVDEYVFDGTTSGLFSARISQPSASVRVLSVSKEGYAGAAGGNEDKEKAEWTLLERRLNEWRTAVIEARRVVGEAEGVAGGWEREREAAEGDRERGQGHGQGGQRRGQGQGQGQRQGGQGQRREKEQAAPQQAAEVAA